MARPLKSGRRDSNPRAPEPYFAIGRSGQRPLLSNAAQARSIDYFLRTVRTRKLPSIWASQLNPSEAARPCSWASM
jgi:hypothetical protein